MLKCDAQVCFVVGIPNHESLDIKKIISSVRSIVVGVFYSVRVNQEITMGGNQVLVYVRDNRNHAPY